MPAQKSRLVRAMSEEEILLITGTLPYATSSGQNWTGVEVHRYRGSPQQTKEFKLPQLAIFLPHVEDPVRAQLRVGRRREAGFQEYEQLRHRRIHGKFIHRYSARMAQFLFIDR